MTAFASNQPRKSDARGTLDDGEGKVPDTNLYAHLASLDEIKENDYNLNIPRYVDTFEKEEVIPLSQVAQELAEVKTEIATTYDNLFGLLNELEGTTPESQAELEKFIGIFGK